MKILIIVGMIVAGYFVFMIAISIIFVSILLIRNFNEVIRETWSKKDRKLKHVIEIFITILAVSLVLAGIYESTFSDDSSNTFWHAFGFALGALISIVLHFHQVTKHLYDELEKLED